MLHELFQCGGSYSIHFSGIWLKNFLNVLKFKIHVHLQRWCVHTASFFRLLLGLAFFVTQVSLLVLGCCYCEIVARVNPSLMLTLLLLFLCFYCYSFVLLLFLCCYCYCYCFFWRRSSAGSDCEQWPRSH